MTLSLKNSVNLEKPLRCVSWLHHNVSRDDVAFIVIIVLQKEGQKHFEAVKEVDEAVGILEQQIEGIDTRMDKTIAAEVKSR